MKEGDFTGLSFGALRDRLRAHAEALGPADNIDLDAVLRYLTLVSDDAHTPDSVDALFHLSRNFFLASKPLQTIRAASLARGSRLLLGRRREIRQRAARSVRVRAQFGIREAR